MAELIDISFADPLDNIHFDQVLLEEAEAGRAGECLRFWESPVPFIVLGRIGRPQEELNIADVLADGIPVLRRCSGGGTVVQGPGCLNYTCILSKEDPAIADLRRSYDDILGRVTAVLRGCGVEAEFLPISDIALAAGRRKISGNAQKRGRDFILHHGTILYAADLSLIVRYLAMPPSMPEYRQARSHLEFVTNAQLDIRRFKDGLCAQFQAAQKIEQVRDGERQRLDQLRAEAKTRVDVAKANPRG